MKQLKNLFDAVFREQEMSIYQYCLMKCDYSRSVAEDIKQQVFKTLWEEILKKNELPAVAIRPWLRKVADHKLSDYYKRRDVERKHIEPLCADDPRFSTVQDLEEEVNRTRLDHHIDQYREQILSQLTPSERQIFELVYTKGLSYREISAITKRSESAERAHMCRVKKKIEKIVKTFSENL